MGKRRRRTGGRDRQRRAWIVPGVLAQDPGGREAWLDVHGYATDTALWLAREVIETAWARGCRSTAARFT